MTPKEMRALAEIGPAMETGEYYNVDSWIQDATSALRAAADEVDRLRTVVENAPHESWCPTRNFKPCTCWKADAL